MLDKKGYARYANSLLCVVLFLLQATYEIRLFPESKNVIFIVTEIGIIVLSK